MRRLRGTTWQAVGAPFIAGATLVSFDDGSGPRIHAASATGTTGVWRLDGAGWVAVGGLPAASVLLAADLGTAPVLLAGSDGVDQWNGSAWLRLYTLPLIVSGHFTLPGRAAAIALLDTDAGPELWVGGSFGANQDVNLVRRTPAGAWSSAGVTANGSINVLQVHNDGAGPALFAAGSFSAIGGVAAPGFARWNGLAWSPLAAGAPGRSSAR